MQAIVGGTAINEIEWGDAIMTRQKSAKTTLEEIREVIRDANMHCVVARDESCHATFDKTRAFWVIEDLLSKGERQASPVLPVKKYWTVKAGQNAPALG